MHIGGNFKSRRDGTCIILTSLMNFWKVLWAYSLCVLQNTATTTEWQKQSLLWLPNYSRISPSFFFSSFFLIRMIEVILNDRLGRKIRVKCNPSDTIGDLKKLVAAQTGKLKWREWTYRHASWEDSHSKVVHHLQGSHHPRGLRNSRRNGSRTVL